MKIFFILGRNPKLSKTEIIEFLKTRKQTYKEILFEKNFLILETNFIPNIQELGGTIQIGEIIFENAKEQLKKYLDKNELIPADKFSYTIFGNQDPQFLKNNFKKRKKKAMLKQGKKQIKFQNGETQGFSKADFYIFFHSANPEHRTPNTNSGFAKVYLGISNQIYDNTDVKKRDMEKPIRRESLAISPRLSKILINISGTKENDLLLDPFCGIGGILQEALIKKINVYGIDKSEQATKDTEKNLKWLTLNYNIKNKYIIENKNSTKTPDLQFNAIATETPLSKILRKKPSNKEAEKMILDFEASIIPILKKLKKIKKINAKIALTFPVIQNLHANTKKIAEKTELKIYIKPILESRPDQFVSRDILVLQ